MSSLKDFAVTILGLFVGNVCVASHFSTRFAWAGSLMDILKQKPAMRNPGRLP